MDKKLLKFGYGLCLALWVGGVSMFTFLVTPIIFRSFDRDAAGRIVGFLFQGYFPYLMSLSLVALVLLVLTRGRRSVRAYRASLVLLAAAIIMNAYVSFSLYPEIKSVKARVPSFVTEPEDSPDRQRFGRLHAISAVLNLLILADGAVLLFLSGDEPE